MGARENRSARAHHANTSRCGLQDRAILKFHAIGGQAAGQDRSGGSGQIDHVAKSGAGGDARADQVNTRAAQGCSRAFRTSVDLHQTDATRDDAGRVHENAHRLDSGVSCADGAGDADRALRRENGSRLRVEAGQVVCDRHRFSRRTRIATGIDRDSAEIGDRQLGIGEVDAGTGYQNARFDVARPARQIQRTALRGDAGPVDVDAIGQARGLGRAGKASTESCEIADHVNGRILNLEEAGGDRGEVAGNAASQGHRLRQKRGVEIDSGPGQRRHVESVGCVDGGKNGVEIEAAFGELEYGHPGGIGAAFAGQGDRATESRYEVRIVGNADADIGDVGAVDLARSGVAGAAGTGDGNIAVGATNQVAAAVEARNQDTRALTGRPARRAGHGDSPGSSFDRIGPHRRRGVDANPGGNPREGTVDGQIVATRSIDGNGGSPGPLQRGALFQHHAMGTGEIEIEEGVIRADIPCLSGQRQAAAVADMDRTAADIDASVVIIIGNGTDRIADQVDRARPGGGKARALPKDEADRVGRDRGRSRMARHHRARQGDATILSRKARVFDDEPLKIAGDR